MTDSLMALHTFVEHVARALNGAGVAPPSEDVLVAVIVAIPTKRTEPPIGGAFHYDTEAKAWEFTDNPSAGQIIPIDGDMN